MLASSASVSRRNHLEVSENGANRRCPNRKDKPTQREKVQEQQIQCRQIGVNQLNVLLTSIFPSGCYDVDVTQNVYKIRAPRTISEVLRGGRGVSLSQANVVLAHDRSRTSYLGFWHKIRYRALGRAQRTLFLGESDSRVLIHFTK
ncbi:hypothetical protein QBC44DRAFT_402566 [Cladorrhinum sp. PSN332]|nr:hypothetical protein QBC44DRAFT_402566 [Cladorrhinum sp. PSN332]